MLPFEKYDIIDAHAHIFPGKIAEKATRSIGDFYDIHMGTSGFPHSLIESGSRIGVKTYLVCSTATKPGQVSSINDFIYTKCIKYPEFYGFAALHPAMENLEREISRVSEMGLHGIKLHPDFQQFNIDDPAVMPLYEAVEKANLPILFHTGDERFTYSAPHRLHNVAKAFPSLRCIAAHFGGYQRWDEAYEFLKLPNIWMDTSSSLFLLKKERALRMIEHFGVDRFFFGTDFPMWGHEQELSYFLDLGLSESENQEILANNFRRVFLDK